MPETQTKYPCCVCGGDSIDTDGFVFGYRAEKNEDGTYNPALPWCAACHVKEFGQERVDGIRETRRVAREHREKTGEPWNPRNR